MITKRTLWGTAVVIAMTLTATAVIEILDDWIGDFGTPLWISAGFFFPFFAGVWWGAGGTGKRGALAGAAMAVFLVLAPGLGYALVADPDYAELRLPLLWALFTPLAMAQGAIALPVGAGGRVRSQQGR